MSQPSPQEASTQGGLIAIITTVEIDFNVVLIFLCLRYFLLWLLLLLVFSEKRFALDFDVDVADIAAAALSRRGKDRMKRKMVRATWALVSATLFEGVEAGNCGRL